MYKVIMYICLDFQRISSSDKDGNKLLEEKILEQNGRGLQRHAV